MDREPIDALARQLIAVMTKHFPKIADDWWQSRVFDKLTFQQSAFARQQQYQSLDQLDLAALLRVADQNWYELSQYLGATSQTRNWLKEAQSIRNRWAHAPVGGLDDETLYRDLDTVERLQLALNCSPQTLEDLKQRKKTLMSKMAGGSQKIAEVVGATAPASKFKPGEIVQLKAQPAVTGAIVANLPGAPEDRFQVFHDGSVSTYYASQLAAAEAGPARNSVMSCPRCDRRRSRWPRSW